jgi:hypothetical protein
MSRSMGKMVRLLLSGLAVCSLSACSGLPQVNAWDKGVLAQTAMRFDSDKLDNKFSEHIYASREGASGGNGVGGGGCGCN